METTIKFILIIILSYFAGSLPTAIVISKRLFGFDIREKGSGNMGSTNAFRVLGWKWGIVVQAIDILKGVLAVVVIGGILGEGIKFGNSIFSDIVIIKFIAGVVAVCGHIWSVFAGFKGGKGINVTIGLFLGIAPIDASIAIGIFIIVVLLSGYISLGSMFGAIALPSSMFIRFNLFGVNIPGYHILIYFVLGLAVLLVFTHRKNILRLAKGTENKFNKLQLIKLKNTDNNI